MGNFLARALTGKFFDLELTGNFFAKGADGQVFSEGANGQIFSRGASVSRNENLTLPAAKTATADLATNGNDKSCADCANGTIDQCVG